MDSIFGHLSTAHTLWAQGHTEAAREQLEQCRDGATPQYHGEWHRLRGLCLQSAGETRQAEEAFLNGIAVAQSPQQLARLHNTYAAHLEYVTRMEEAVDHYLTAEHLFRQTHDAESIVANTYNLGRIYLQLGRFADAGHKFDSALSFTGRAHSQASPTLIHAGRSIIALIRQQPHLALQRGELDHHKAIHPVYELRALQARMTVLMSLGMVNEANSTLQHLNRLRPLQDDPAEGATSRILAGILKGDPVALATVPSGVHPSWKVRALLHRTLFTTDSREAVCLAQEARSLHQRHEEAIFDVMFPAAHRQLTELGVPLTRALPPGPTVLTVSIRGVLRLAINAEVIQARLPAPSAAVLAALITEGALTTSDLLQDVLGTEKTAGLERAVERVRVLIGDATAITSQGEGRGRRWSLSAAYQWRMDDSCTGSVLSGLDSPYAQRRELA